eukprot:904180-Pyramimonas_sp.AAC.1
MPASGGGREVYTKVYDERYTPGGQAEAHASQRGGDVVTPAAHVPPPCGICALAAVAHACTGGVAKVERVPQRPPRHAAPASKR